MEAGIKEPGQASKVRKGCGYSCQPVRGKTVPDSDPHFPLHLFLLALEKGYKMVRSTLALPSSFPLPPTE